MACLFQAGKFSFPWQISRNDFSAFQFQVKSEPQRIFTAAQSPTQDFPASTRDFPWIGGWQQIYGSQIENWTVFIQIFGVKFGILLAWRRWSHHEINWACSLQLSGFSCSHSFLAVTNKNSHYSCFPKK